MTQETIDQAMQTAFSHHQDGRLQEAEAIYRQVLTQHPDHPGALHLLGVIAHQVGRHDVAVDLIGRAVTLQPNFPEAYVNLGVALKDNGQLDEAIAAYRQALTLNPDVPQVHNNLGDALKDKGQFDDALAACRQAIALKPVYPEAYNNLGNVLQAQGQLDEAITAYRQALAFKPGYAEVHNNLGNVLREKGLLDDAITACRQALALKPNYPKACSNLGNALKEKGQLDDAIAAYRQALTLDPNYPEAHCNLGAALYDQGQFDSAADSCRRAIALKPDFPEACSNLGKVLQKKGQLDDAIAAYRQAIALKPGYAEAYFYLGDALKDEGRLDEALACLDQALVLEPDNARYLSNRIILTNYHPACDAAGHLQQCLQWDRLFALPLRRNLPPHTNDRSPDRRLKIGYVSADFYAHASACFLMPLLSHHNPANTDIYCYADVSQPDLMTERFRSLVPHWRDITTLSDAQFAEQVRSDAIDILVDLKLHTAGNRLLAFARRPAPVQATWLGYPGTTGLATIDYRLTDPYLDPPGQGDDCYSEKSIRLPHSFWCYQPVVDSPLPNPLPALQAGHFTFGCFNDYCKVTPAALQLWSKVLLSVPGSRMLIYAPDGSHRQKAQQVFQANGISSDRIEFVGKRPTSEYFSFFQRVDLCLDPIPCPGHTTALDGLWMGVPAVTLSGATAICRAGVSILSNIGLPEFIALTPAEYVALAAKLAADLPRLSELRAALRPRMLQSPLMNAAQFAADIEAAYRQMWQNWYDTGK